METELSVWHLIANAGILVQLVMLLLMLASVVSWALIFQRLQVFRKARQAQLEFEDRFWSGMDLGQLYKEVSAEPTPFSGMESVFRAGFKEFSRLRQQSRDADAVMEGTQRAMRVAFPGSRSAWKPICRSWPRLVPPALRWPVRYRVGGHHELLPRSGAGAAGHAGHGGAGYL